MLRRLPAVTLVLAGVLSLAACGGSSSTEPPSSPSAAPSQSSAMSAEPSSPPSAVPTTADALPRTVVAACNGVALRTSASTTGRLIARISTGVSVRAVELVTGDSYTTGACGTAGDSWYRIRRVGGKTVKSLYGVTDVYAAAGFFQ